jgi:transcriptional regulator with XRE-family HTH domain
MSNQNYRKARKDASIRVETAASNLGVSITTLLNWERGDTKPNAENIRAMAELYKVTSDYLLGLAV